MTIQSQISTFIPRNYDVFGGLDVDKHSIAVTFCNHEEPGTMHRFDLFYAVSLTGQKRLDRVVDDGGEGNNIAGRNL
jgi:hypothetical protein